MAHVGAYLATLRTGQFSQIEVAEKLGVSEKIVRDWEKGNHEPKITYMNRLLTLLRGSWDDVRQLMSDTATEELARRIAHRRLAGNGLTDDQRAYLDSLSDDQRAALLAVAEQMTRRS